MIPAKNQYVKLILRNSIKVEGFVKFWNSKKVVLKAADSDNVLTIHYPKEILVSIVVPEKKLPVKLTITQAEIYDKITEQIKELSVNEAPGILPIEKIKKLAALKAEATAAEKEIIANKLKDFTSLGPQKVIYGLPNFNSNTIVEQHTEEKAGGKD